MNKYDASSIKVLKGLDAVKKRPGMYIGNTEDGTGLHQMFYEVIDNSVDEYLAGYGKEILVTLHSDDSISVEDFGRGMPVEEHQQEGVSAAQVIMTYLHAGGKFDQDNYSISGGLHGVGVSVVNALSDWLQLSIYRDGYHYTMSFTLGIPDGPLRREGSCDHNRTGTRISFMPSKSFFSNVYHFDIDTITKRLMQISFLNEKLSLSFTDEKTGFHKEYYHENGLVDYVYFLHGKGKNSLLIDRVLLFSGNDNNTKFQCAISWCDGYQEKSLSFTNNICQVDGGSHVSGFRSALTRTFQNYISASKISKKYHDIDISSDDIREGLISIISVYTPNPQFSSQTKSKLVSLNVKKSVERLFSRFFQEWLEENPSLAHIIIDKIFKSAKAREAARKARLLIRRKSSLENLSLPGKLSDCQTRDPQEAEIFIVEGDSAGATAKQARSRYNQAILPLKGKILNVEKSDLDKILSNQEITTLISALGCGIGDSFNIDSLRYHKVIIMTDADIDGSHIRSLLLTFFYRYMPNIISSGYLYVAQPPLYGVRKSYSSQIQYLLDDAAFVDYFFTRIVEIVSFESLDNSNQNKTFLYHLRNIRKYRFEYLTLLNRCNVPSVILNAFLMFYKFHDDREEYMSSYFEHYARDYQESISFVNSSENDIYTFYSLYKKISREYTLSCDFVNKSSYKDMMDAFSYLSNYKWPCRCCIYKEKCVFYDPFVMLETLLEKSQKGFLINRYKGLGEMNPDQLWMTTLDPNRRSLCQMQLDDNKEYVDNIFYKLMGSVVQPRKKFIIDNALKVSVDV